MEMLPLDILTDLLQDAVEFSQQGGEILRKYWGKLKDIQEKDFAGDLVTEADKASEEVILGAIHKKHPKHDILSEEAGKITYEDHEFLWVVDPLDGTTNYTHQYPLVSVSIGLLYQGKPIVGVVYNPIYDELFQAARGMGTMMNGHIVNVTKTSTLNKSLLATGFAYDRQENPETNYAEFCHLTHITQGVRRGGSAALDLAFVASGRLEGFWERGLKPWDMAAGVLLVQEAGGVVSDYDMSAWDINSGKILATNGHIHQIISGELQKKHPLP